MGRIKTVRIRRVLLIPALAPFLAVLIISAFNREPSLRLKLLIWQSPALPLGAWSALAATVGASFSGVASLLLLTPTIRSSVSYQTSKEPAQTPFQPTDLPGYTATRVERDIRDPAPTVAVPYRVIKRKATSKPSRSATPTTKTTDASSFADDWGDDPNQDW